MTSQEFKNTYLNTNVLFDKLVAPTRLKQASQMDMLNTAPESVKNYFDLTVSNEEIDDITSYADLLVLLDCDLHEFNSTIEFFQSKKDTTAVHFIKRLMHPNLDAYKELQYQPIRIGLFR